ncbi:glycoside hydrolase family protein [Photorhabdus hainanensis]|uniref:glycoside hydrolase family protein n=1 Tax=Photorhabdus hainanensis TaxID=1004166 RepID=UPI001BD1DB8F
MAILSQFLDGKEGNWLSVYQDAGGIWTICHGITHIDGQPVKKGMKLTATHTPFSERNLIKTKCRIKRPALCQ